MPSITRRYVTTGRGQVHARRLDAAGEETCPPLVCLHPAPSSGLYFTTVMPLLNRGRAVIAPDYPGYGGSDALPEPPSIADYAQAMLQFLDAADAGTPVDLLGFHTGCLVGVEMALTRPPAIRRLVLCDVPCFDAAQRQGLRDKMAKPMGISPELDSIAGAWRFNVTTRLDDVSLPRAFELFAEHLRAGDNDSLGFGAAFSYDCETRFAALQADVTVLATQSGLHAPSIRAAKTIPGATLVDVTEVTTAVFESGAAAIAKRITGALER